MQAYEALGGQPMVGDAPREAPKEAYFDVAAALAAEVADLKDATKQLFFFHKLNITSLVYVEFKYEGDPSPTALVTWTCQRAKASEQGTAFFFQGIDAKHTAKQPITYPRLTVPLAMYLTRLILIFRFG
jgi:hypothetical protein